MGERDLRAVTDSNEGNPYLADIYAATSLESNFEDLAVEGEVPADLEGAYVRNGPNPRYAPRGRYHWFDGDGMIHAIRFAGGRASYRNRWVRTAHLAEEDAAGQSLWTGLLHSVADNPRHSPYNAVRQQRWETELHRNVPVRFAVVPRRGSADSVRWFEAEPCYVYHTVNAWEEGGEVVMIAYRDDDPLPAPSYERDGAWAHVIANLRIRARLHCWRLNLATGETREHPIDDRNTKFNTVNMGYLGKPTRYAYTMSIAEAATLLFDGIVKYDTRTGASQSYAFGPGRYGSEAVFAPSNGRTGAENEGDRDDEDDGYVIAFVGDQRDSTAEAVVLDARNGAAKPLARVRIPQRVPAGFHGCWVPGSVLWALIAHKEHHDQRIHPGRSPDRLCQ